MFVDPGWKSRDNFSNFRRKLIFSNFYLDFWGKISEELGDLRSPHSSDFSPLNPYTRSRDISTLNPHFLDFSDQTVTQSDPNDPKVLLGCLLLFLIYNVFILCVNIIYRPQNYVFNIL